MDLTTEVVMAYAKAGAMSDYDRQQAKVALYASNGKKPEHAYPIALRLVEQMLVQAEKNFESEMRDLARQFPVDESPVVRDAIQRWEKG
jgi:hypothetical protein